MLPIIIATVTLVLMRFSYVYGYTNGIVFCEQLVKREVERMNSEKREKTVSPPL